MCLILEAGLLWFWDDNLNLRNLCGTYVLNSLGGRCLVLVAVFLVLNQFYNWSLREGSIMGLGINHLEKV